MKKNGNTVVRLELSYEQFLGVLKKWNAYVWPELKYTPRDFPTMRSEAATQGVPPGVEVSSSIKFSELAAALWKSLEAGADEVDRIHDEVYVEAQVEHFKESYQSPEQVAEAQEEDWWGGKLDHPFEMFIELGKSAQTTLVRDGFLDKAIEIFKEAESINRQKRQDEIEAKVRRKEEARARRAAPDYIKPISQHTRKLVRELDKQCVLCGSEGTNPANNRYILLKANGYKVEDVVLACKSCEIKLQGKPLEDAGMKPLFGRFPHMGSGAQ
jgi:hypothetical protein